jgi:YHS domain-containing protein
MVRAMTGVMGLALALSLVGPAVAKPKMAKSPGKAMACPVCKMPLSTKKTAANPTLVKLGGKTYYCCAQCDMSKLGKTGKSKMSKASGTK